MRASVLVLGPLLARTGEARVSHAGRLRDRRPARSICTSRAWSRWAPTFRLDGGYIDGAANGRLRGATIVFPFVSVGATENLLMAAALADGRTVLANAAREPEIGDLARCLNAMGARIAGIDSDRLTIDGVERLHGAEHAHHPGPDRDRHLCLRRSHHRRRGDAAQRPGWSISAPRCARCARPAWRSSSSRAACMCAG